MVSAFPTKYSDQRLCHLRLSLASRSLVMFATYRWTKLWSQWWVRVSCQFFGSCSAIAEVHHAWCARCATQHWECGFCSSVRARCSCRESGGYTGHPRRVGQRGGSPGVQVHKIGFYILDLCSSIHMQKYVLRRWTWSGTLSWSMYV